MKYGEVEVYLHQSWPQCYMETSGQLHTPTSLGKGLPVPVREEADIVPETVGTLWSGQIVSPLRVIERRPSSPSLYRLSYPGSRTP
jgi:hypothetical protein